MLFMVENRITGQFIASASAFSLDAVWDDLAVEAGYESCLVAWEDEGNAFAELVVTQVGLA